MAREYLAPGVYTETVRPVGRPIEGVSTTTCVFLGEAVRGPVNVPVLITSWTDYMRLYAGGLDTPFMRDADLAYAVYGFFQNGGRRCYIVRVGRSPMRPDPGGELTPRKAQAVIANGAQFVRARDEGKWGNGLVAEVEKNDDGISLDPDEELFNVIVSFKGEQVEFWRGFGNDPDRRNYFERINLQSAFIDFYGGDKLAVGRYALTGGQDGSAPVDIDYLHALHGIAELPDRNMIAIPGQTSRAVLRGLLDWCSKDERTFPILEMPLFMTTQQARDERRWLGAAPRGAIYLPWFKVLDPLSTNGEPRITPPAGHIAGVFARQTNERGVHKAPAGVEANIRGIVDAVQEFGFGDSEILNPASVNVIMRRPNYGVVVWGARTLTTDRTMIYVSDQRLNMFIKQSLENGTQWVVFEPNDSLLWKSVRVTCEEFLHVLWSVHGSLFGATADEAFFVVCDETNNTQATIDAGFLFVDIGYAPVKPAEFVVFRIAHSMRTSG